MTHPLAVYGVGNALVDMEYQIDDAFLGDHDVAKGHMTLVDEPRLTQLTEALVNYTHSPCSGGSAANTIYAVQAFGQDSGYGCLVGEDQVGNYFLEDMRAAGVHIAGVNQSPADQTGRCLVLITPDGERSMNTYLGASTLLNPAALDPDAIRRSRYLYIEGYLSSSSTSTAVALEARTIAESANLATTLTLSDPSMIEFFRDNLVEILGNGIDHLFCNEEEALTWAKTDRIDIAATELSDIARGVSITLGAAGSMVVTNGKRSQVPGVKVKTVDTSGAGDIYAGATLFAMAQGWDAEQGAKLANRAAALVVSDFGARLNAADRYLQLLDEM